MNQPEYNEVTEDFTAKSAELLNNLEEKVAATIAKQRHVYHRLCGVLAECKEIIACTSGHLENLKKSILHVKAIPINTLVLNYCYAEAKNDRRMLREARKMISLIGLDDPNLDDQVRQEIDQKIRAETEIQDFIQRAERGLQGFRRMWQTFEDNVNAYKTVIEGHNVLVSGMLASLRSSISEESETKETFTDFFTMTVFSITCFIMYWKDL